MRILLAFDKFKGALSAAGACAAAANAIERTACGDRVETAPLTDGGEGFCSILTGATGGRIAQCEVRDPLGRSVHALIGWVDAAAVPATARARMGVAAANRLAVIEMASASGLPLLAPNERDPWKTAAQGTGDLIRQAARQGADAIVLGIGGSATNDAGCGALQALGVRFLDAHGNEVSPLVPETFGTVARVLPPSGSSLPPVIIASDVDSPLLGPAGASAVFGPQKGLDSVERMDGVLTRMAILLAEAADEPPDPAAPAMGAAGGIAFGLSCVAPVRLLAGFALVADWLGLEDKLKHSDWVVTGEGRLDRSSLTGKGPVALLRMAGRAGPHKAVFAGAVVDEAAEALRAEVGNCRFAALSDPSWALDEALARTGVRLGEEVALWRRSLA